MMVMAGTIDAAANGATLNDQFSRGVTRDRAASASSPTRQAVALHRRRPSNLLEARRAPPSLIRPARRRRSRMTADDESLGRCVFLSPSFSSRAQSLRKNRISSMFQRAPISSSSDPQRASVKIVPPSRRTFSISTVPQRREKTAGARREPIFFTLAVHTLHPLFSTTRGFADKSRHLFVSPKNKQQIAPLRRGSLT